MLVWERVYTLTLNLNGGNWADASDNKTQYSASDLTLPSPTAPSTLTGYVFSGWIDKDNNYGLVGTDGMAIPSGTTGNKTYYAVYHTISAGNKADTTTTGSIEFVAVQGGTVPLAEDYMPVVSNFSMSKHEITQGQWRAVMGSGHTSQSSTDGEPDNNPVNYVSWYHAIAFCNKLSIAEGKQPCYSVSGVDFNTLTYAEIPEGRLDPDWDAAICDWNADGYRLPTEAEWEYAARGGINHSAFTYSGSNIISDVAWYSGNSSNKSHEVGTKTANALGICDMSGNVDEWCWDWYSDSGYASANNGNTNNPTGASSSSDSYRVYRNGNWQYGASYCMVSYRDKKYASVTYSGVTGFRIVCRP